MFSYTSTGNADSPQARRDMYLVRLLVEIYGEGMIIR